MQRSPLCTKCRHWVDGDWGRCAVHPDGIPQQYLEGGTDHFDPDGADGGVTFEPLPELLEIDGFAADLNRRAKAAGSKRRWP